MITRFALAAAAALAVMAWASVSLVKTGVNKERARVETIGKKIDARAKVARKKAETRPHDALRAFCRDCN